MAKKACETAKALKFFNDFFDVLNGYSKHKKPNPDRILINDKTYHVAFLREENGKVHQMWFLNESTLLSERSILCLQNLEATIDAYIAMWNELKSLGIIHIKISLFIFFYFQYIIFDWLLLFLALKK